MINLKLLNKVNIKIFLIIIFLFNSNISYGKDNRIVFKINNKAFTLLDINKRIDYLNFVGSNDELNEKIVIDDYISANLFYEYYKKNIRSDNYDQKILDIYNNIFETNKKNNKEYNFIIDKENIIKNIKLDFVRKTILENILKSSLDKINASKEEMDLLYNIKLQYINIETIDYLNIKKQLEKINNFDIKNIINILNTNEINYFFKEKEINNLDGVDIRIKNNILLNKEYFIIQNDKKVSIIVIQKSFATLDGMIGNLYSIRSKDVLNSEYLKCSNLKNKKNEINIINKEYKLSTLNDELKRNLINVNDYYKYYNNNEQIYIVLCDIKFDTKKLQSINFNKLINQNVNDIEKKFVNKYSELYNLIKFNA